MILGKIGPISKWQRRFLTALFEAVFALRGRVNFTNLARFSPLHEQTFRRQFAQGFDWLRFNLALFAVACAGSDAPVIAAVDCTFLPKSGTETYGLDRFWSGAESRTRRGLEASVLALIDTSTGRTFAAGAAQTPPDLAKPGAGERSRIDFYTDQLTGSLSGLEHVRHVVADGYYAKTKVFDGVRGAGRHLITKLRSDANLRYLYEGERKDGPGAPKVYDGKVRFDDLSRFDRAGRLEDKPHVEVYAKKLNAPHFKRDFLVVVLRDTKANSYVVLASTDTQLDPTTVVRFYRLRFQIEFVFRDAKQFTGLTHCQARSRRKIRFHLNMSFQHEFST